MRLLSCEGRILAEIFGAYMCCEPATPRVDGLVEEVGAEVIDNDEFERTDEFGTEDKLLRFLGFIFFSLTTIFAARILAKGLVDHESIGW